MEDLPIELWHLIFDHLELTDLFSCALVNKQFYSILKEYRIRELAFTRPAHTWFHLVRRDYKHQADFTAASILKRSSFNFEYLRRLKIGISSTIDLNDINRLSHLEELDIDLTNYNKQNRTLSLANLKLLYVFPSDHLPFLELHMPRLAELCTSSLSKLKFAHPESIRSIQTFYHGGKLSTFANLEYLIFTDRYNQLDFHRFPDTVLNEFGLNNLNNLKEIGFYYYNLKYEGKNLSNFKKLLQNILLLQRADLKVFWRQVQITDIDLLNEYERLGKNEVGKLIVFQFRHYEKLKDKADFFRNLGFNEAMSKLTKAGFDVRSEKFVSKFFAKYSFAKITVNGSVKERQFLMQLIKRSPNLSSLVFSIDDLEQSFFDQMAEIIRLNRIPVQHLRIKTLFSRLNYEFVLKLPDLQLIQTSPDMPIELVLKLIRTRSIIVINGSYCIEKLSANRFLLSSKPASLKELFEWLNTKSASAKLL